MEWTKAKRNGACDGKLRKHSTLGKKCDACDEIGDHWTDNCPIFKKRTVRIVKPQPQCIACGETSDHWTCECPHGPPIQKPVPRINQENVVVVANLTREDGDSDLFELFREFNPSRCCVYPEFKPVTGELTGFGSGAGQVSFVTDEDARKATEKLRGYVYKGRALHVNWITVKGTPRLGG